MLPDERTLWGEKCPLKKPTKKNNGYYRREANKQHTERVYAKGQVDRIKKSILNLHTFRSPIQSVTRAEMLEKSTVSY